jgi:ribosomal protein L37E
LELLVTSIGGVGEVVRLSRRKTNGTNDKKRIRLWWFEDLLGSLPLPPELRWLEPLLTRSTSTRKKKATPVQGKKISPAYSRSSMITCRNCGYELNLKEFQFCGRCGVALREGETKIY